MYVFVKGDGATPLNGTTTGVAGTRGRGGGVGRGSFGTARVGNGRGKVYSGRENTPVRSIWRTPHGVGEWSGATYKQGNSGVSLGKTPQGLCGQPEQEIVETELDGLALEAVDSGNKALEFLGLHVDDEQISPNKAFTSPINQQEMAVNLIITWNDKL
ncbi:hypothetical protein AgCh_013360 [Apium graveolens]